MEGYKELLNQLTGLVNSLEKGDLSLEELNELESVTRTLHERSIILRYKAFESSVLGENTSSKEVDMEEETIGPDAEAAKTDVEPVGPEPVEAVEVEAEESEEEPAFDFAIFDEEPVSPTPPAEAVEIEGTGEDEKAVESEPVKTVIEPVSPAPIAEAIEEESTEAKGQEEPEVITPEPVEEEKQEEIQPEPTPEPAKSSGGSFLDHFSLQDNSLAGRFSAGPLDSLIGAFGLNERLRFINDLFDGSSEKFSDAIKALDSQSDLDTARTKVAGYAEENEWDPEEEVVAEFMNYLNRRYA